jgi:hypothetical protein
LELETTVWVEISAIYDTSGCVIQSYFHYDSQIAALAAIIGGRLFGEFRFLEFRTLVFRFPIQSSAQNFVAAIGVSLGSNEVSCRLKD